MCFVAFWHSTALYNNGTIEQAQPQSSSCSARSARSFAIWPCRMQRNRVSETGRATDLISHSHSHSTHLEVVEDVVHFVLQRIHGGLQHAEGCGVGRGVSRSLDFDKNIVLQRVRVLIPRELDLPVSQKLAT